MSNRFLHEKNNFIFDSAAGIHHRPDKNFRCRILIFYYFSVFFRFFLFLVRNDTVKLRNKHKTMKDAIRRCHLVNLYEKNAGP